MFEHYVAKFGGNIVTEGDYENQCIIGNDRSMQGP